MTNPSPGKLAHNEVGQHPAEGMLEMPCLEIAATAAYLHLTADNWLLLVYPKWNRSQQYNNLIFHTTPVLCMSLPLSIDQSNERRQLISIYDFIYLSIRLNKNLPFCKLIMTICIIIEHLDFVRMPFKVKSLIIDVRLTPFS